MTAQRDDRTAGLPDGTDRVIEGVPKGGEDGTFIAKDRALVKKRKSPAPKGKAERPAIGGGSAEGGLAERFRSGREKLANQAGDKARGLVSQGLGRTSEALSNVSKMVGDTAAGIDERLGADYGEYARRAAGAIENVSNTIAEKDPDELIEDTRNFVRNSPGVALAGAAIVGFAIARLLKSGLARNEGEDDEA